jgi:hypothetical protein
MHRFSRSGSCLVPSASTSTSTSTRPRRQHSVLHWQALTGGGPQPCPLQTLPTLSARRSHPGEGAPKPVTVAQWAHCAFVARALGGRVPTVRHVRSDVQGVMVGTVVLVAATTAQVRCLAHDNDSLAHRLLAAGTERNGGARFPCVLASNCCAHWTGADVEPGPVDLVCADRCDSRDHASCSSACSCGPGRGSRPDFLHARSGTGGGVVTHPALDRLVSQVPHRGIRGGWFVVVVVVVVTVCVWGGGGGTWYSCLSTSWTPCIRGPPPHVHTLVAPPCILTSHAHLFTPLPPYLNLQAAAEGAGVHWCAS